ncbi:MAG: GDP-mannose 4,6-dehydratase, partial [Candidatus Latescibacterota bacterium]|nr:GDP-mannose 4,6-dehydratase [Candidatus Latescibacterota bacterium]
FVTKKITRAAARIKLGMQEKLFLGNLEAKRDWGFAGDYVKAMWLMLQQENPDDYVIATGKTHTVKEWLDEVFKHAGLDVSHEVPLLLGDPTKAKEKLGWEPVVGFEDLARMMYHADFSEAEKELISKKIDIAIHSLKDVPYRETRGLIIKTFLKRNSPKEVLISKNNLTFEKLKKNSIVGTSSYRREFQLRRMRPDLKF